MGIPPPRLQTHLLILSTYGRHKRYRCPFPCVVLVGGAPYLRADPPLFPILSTW